MPATPVSMVAPVVKVTTDTHVTALTHHGVGGIVAVVSIPLGTSTLFARWCFHKRPLFILSVTLILQK